jgi:CRP/FNR family transcriptional regulator
MPIAHTLSQSSRSTIQGTAGCMLEPLRLLAPSEYLFQEGDKLAQPYRVERGSLCHYTRRDDGSPEIIELVFPGDIIGFVHLGTHISTARATMESAVRALPAKEFEMALKADAHLAARVAAMADREFDYRRAHAILSSDDRPVARVASYLAAISSANAHEGRDARLIREETSSPVVADALQMSPDRLAASLAELERRSLIQLTATGLRIVDADALQAFSEAAARPACHRKRDSRLRSGVMRSPMTAAERRAFNDGLQAALLAICVEGGEDTPLCSNTGSDVCLGCSNLPNKQKQLCARIKSLRYGRTVGGDIAMENAPGAMSAEKTISPHGEASA